METPNILIIMADQLTPFMTGFYGNSQVKTPNLDMLCAQSVRFDNAYTPYPLCKLVFYHNCDTDLNPDFDHLGEFKIPDKYVRRAMSRIGEDLYPLI